MNRKIAVAALLIIAGIVVSSAQAQETALKFTYKTNTDKSVDFSYEKTDPGTYTVIFNFTNLTNSGEPRQQYTVSGYSGNMLSLKPNNKEQGIGFSYTYWYIRGKLKPRYDPEFIYLLPCKKGSSVKAVEAGFVNATYFGNTTPDDWKVYRFYTPAEDTVTAARKGIVVSIKDIYSTDALGEVAYTSAQNELVIEHTDGTLAIYKGFKKGSFAVKVGQTVFPGAVLGVNSKYSQSGAYGISLMIYYLKAAEAGSQRNQTLQNSKSLYGFITPKFCTAGDPAAILVSQQQYAAADTPDIIKKELTKRELKQLK